MAKEATKLSIRAYAKYLGISDASIRKAIKNNKIKKGISYKTQMQHGKEIEVPEISKEIADKEYGFLHLNDKVKPGQNKVKKNALPTVEKNISNKKISTQVEPENVSESENLSEEDEQLISSMGVANTLSYQETTRRREIIGLVMDKKKLQELEGVLVRRDAVEKSMFAFADEFKKALMNIPARVTAEVRSAASEVEAQTVITIELIEILNQFSNLEQLKI
jgi:galactitol-specific phosphotransferase system IIB component